MRPLPLAASSAAHASRGRSRHGAITVGAAGGVAPRHRPRAGTQKQKTKAPDLRAKPGAVETGNRSVMNLRRGRTWGNHARPLTPADDAYQASQRWHLFTAALCCGNSQLQLRLEGNVTRTAVRASRSLALRGAKITDAAAGAAPRRRMPPAQRRDPDSALACRSGFGIKVVKAVGPLGLRVGLADDVSAPDCGAFHGAS